MSSGVKNLCSNEKETIGRNIKSTTLFKNSLEANSATGIEEINDKKSIVTYSLTDTYPLNLAVRLDYDKSLSAWKEKRYIFFIITTGIIIGSIIIGYVFFFLYRNY